MRTDPANVGQLQGWDGDTGAFWAANAQRFDDGVAGYHEQFLATAAIDATETVLDIGCGAGQTTRDAARRATAGSALGVDLSARLIALARRLAAGEHLPNATFRQADAACEPFPDRAFDVALSRHGAMFFGNPPAAFANVARALRPGGRIVLLTWQPFKRQEWLRAFFRVLAAGRELSPPPPDAPGPFALSDPERTRQLLTAAGFVDVRCRGLAAPMYYGAEPGDATRFVAGQQAGLLRGLESTVADLAVDALRDVMAEHLTDRGVLFESACWLVEARRG